MPPPGVLVILCLNFCSFDLKTWFKVSKYSIQRCSNGVRQFYQCGETVMPRRWTVIWTRRDRWWQRSGGSGVRGTGGQGDSWEKSHCLEIWRSSSGVCVTAVCTLWPLSGVDVPCCCHLNIVSYFKFNKLSCLRQFILINKLIFLSSSSQASVTSKEQKKCFLCINPLNSFY